MLHIVRGYSNGLTFALHYITCLRLQCCVRVTEYAQENDFNFGDNNVTTSLTSTNTTQQTLKPRLMEDEQLLVDNDAGSGDDLEEGSGEDLLTTREDDVTVSTTMRTETETTTAYKTTSSVQPRTSSLQTTTTTTTVTSATIPTFTTQEPVSGEPG